jgi:TRAP-type transport system periplasmic protein
MKRNLVIFFVAALWAVVSWINPNAAWAQDKTVTLRYANFFPPVHPISLLSEEWGKEVEKQTRGRVKITYFHGGSLAPAAETPDSLVKGIADIGLSFCAYTRGRFPLTEVLDLPLGYKSSVVATALANAYLEKFKPKEFDDFEVMYLHTSAPHHINARKPVRTLEDLRGMKIRSTGTSAKVVEALGGVAVAMPMSDSYDALKRGIAEGIICPFEPLKGYKLSEIVTYTTPLGSAYVNTAYVLMNKRKWESLAPDIREVISRINREWMKKQSELWDSLEEGGRQALREVGGEIIQLSAEENARWSERLRPILDGYVKEKEARGLPGAEALKFCVDYLKEHQK